MVFTVFSARVLHNSHFPGFRSGPKRTATKSYADSWWYHLGKCLLWLFQAHLSFWFFGNFCRPLPFAYLNSGSLVFTKFGHQPFQYSKTLSWIGILQTPQQIKISESGNLGSLQIVLMTGCNIPCFKILAWRGKLHAVEHFRILEFKTRGIKNLECPIA